MSGLGRRSHYRKHLTDAVLHDFPEPDTAEGERIAKVVGTRGSNQFEIVVASPASKCKATRENDANGAGAGKEERLPSVSVVEPASTNEERSIQLAILPTKFRKLVWLKRNDFVIVRCGEDQDGEEKLDTTGSIRYQIEHILYKEQVKHLKKEGLWPNDDFFSESTNKSGDSAAAHDTTEIPRTNQHNAGEEGNLSCDLAEEDEEHHGDGIVYDAVDDFVNTNRVATLRVEDSESESESENE